MTYLPRYLRKQENQTRIELGPTVEGLRGEERLREEKSFIILCCVMYTTYVHRYLLRTYIVHSR